MAPASQTLFSVTLFLALSSLLAWSNRRHRAVATTLERGERSVKTF
ncbi:MAG TPA: hypothetical protein VHW09_15285 [Bryobacteraceae bacterium]|nr:hypothetical protein [Bryobacteraceae bacterium]